MNFKTLLIAIMVLFISSNVCAVTTCPSAADWIYQKDSGWSLSPTLSSSWTVIIQSNDRSKIVPPAEALVEMQVECGLLGWCSNHLTCGYYKPSNLADPIIVLLSKDKRNVSWSSIKDYIYSDWNTITCQTMVTNVDACSWQWEK